MFYKERPDGLQPCKCDPRCGPESAAPSKGAIMKRHYYRSPNIALCLALFVSMIAFAQSEKISLKIFPEPNQTVRLRMAQEMELERSFESETPLSAPLPGPMKMIVKNVFALTHKIGSRDNEGNIAAELTYDEVNSETTINGEPMQTDYAAGKFIGKKILATFNKQGEVIDLKIPPEMGLPEEAFKQMIKSLYGSVPQAPIGVGEIAT